jgi:citrate lyase subunit beta/citryl-CoA lyase
MRIHRSFLFAPGNRPRFVEKVAHCGADAVTLDLEDAVPIAEKADTRHAVREALTAMSNCPVYVRINPLVAATSFSQAIGEADLEAIVCGDLAGVMLPKTERAVEAQQAESILCRLEHERGLPPGGIDLIPIIETACGVYHAFDIASAGTRINRLAFGAGDFTRDIGVRWSRREVESQYARAALVVASRAADIEAPLDSVWIDIRDPRGLTRSARMAKQLGFQGKMAIHPTQIEPINTAFSPSQEELAYAKRAVAAFEAAEAAGEASIQLDGQMIDYPIAQAAQRLLDMAEALGTHRR